MVEQTNTPPPVVSPQKNRKIPNDNKPTDGPAVNQRNVQQGPSGVGGWLLLLVIGMMVLGPLLGAGGIFGEFTMSENMYTDLKSIEQWKDYKAVVWIVFFVIVAISFYGGWGLTQKKDYTAVRRAKAILWITGPVGILVLGLLKPIILHTDFYAETLVSTLIGSIVSAAIWTTYLTKSKRVQNTYGGHEPY